MATCIQYTLCFVQTLEVKAPALCVFVFCVSLAWPARNAAAGSFAVVAVRPWPTAPWLHGPCLLAAAAQLFDSTSRPLRARHATPRLQARTLGVVTLALVPL